MRVKPEQLSSQLQRGLAPIYLVCGDEPLQVQESGEAIRVQARQKGYSEREILTVSPVFDWDLLWQTSHSLSLFAARRLIELRLTGAKPGDKGNAALVDYVAHPAPDTVLLITASKLDAQAQASSWFKALERTGVVVQVWPVEARTLPAWIMQRLRAKGMQASSEAAALLAERVEGNLLAAAQDIEKLYLLYGPTSIDAVKVAEAVADSARFDVYDLVDTALLGDAVRATRTLYGLRAEGAEPTLVLWALVREVRSLAGMAYDCRKGASVEPVLIKHRVWEKRKAAVRQALQRHPLRHWQKLLSIAARIDRVIKGATPGNAWDELLQLSLAIAGVRLWNEEI